MEPDVTELIYSEPRIYALRPASRNLNEGDNTAHQEESNGVALNCHMAQNWDVQRNNSASRFGDDGSALSGSFSESTEQPQPEHPSRPITRRGFRRPREPTSQFTSQEWQASGQEWVNPSNILDNGTLGSANEYEEVVPLVDHQIERHTEYNAIHTSSLDNNYVIPNEPPALHNRRTGHQIRDQDGAHGSNNDYISIVDRSNERIAMNMKRYIFACLGMPGIPGMSSRMNHFCTGFGVLAYICLFIWGIVCVSLSAIALIKATETVFVAAILCGSYFIFLGFYWLILFRWNRKSEAQSRIVTFSFLTTLWIVLCLYFIGSMTSLIVELYHNPCYITFLFNKVCMLHSVYKYVPFLSISSMLVLWLVYVFIFALHFLYTCSK